MTRILESRQVRTSTEAKAARHRARQEDTREGKRVKIQTTTTMQPDGRLLTVRTVTTSTRREAPEQSERY